MTRYVHTGTDARDQVGAEIQRESVQALCPGADLRSLEKKRMLYSSPKCAICWVSHVPKELSHPPKLEDNVFLICTKV